MQVDAPPQRLVFAYDQQELAPLQPARSPSGGLRFVAGVAGFAAIWIVLYMLWVHVPYLSSGSDVVFRAKIEAEQHGNIFRSVGPGQKKIVIFGTSKILAGFVPEQFDAAAAASGIQVFSFNSGYPARASFVPELAAMISHTTVPDVVLLTEAWSDEPAPTFFHPFENEHALAELIFPFRHLLRDGLSFFGNARLHGGIAKYYRVAQGNAERMIRDRGYYFIAEQSHYPHDQLPDSFSLPTDNPKHVASRAGHAESPEATELRSLILNNHLTCLYVPAYARARAVAPSPAENSAFRDEARHAGCEVTGPDYFSYPNALFSDEIHLNPAGAAVFTSDLFRTIRPKLEHAVQ